MYFNQEEDKINSKEPNVDRIMDKADIFKKLHLDGSKKILILNVPQEFNSIHSRLAYDKNFVRENINHYDFIQVFATTVKTRNPVGCIFVERSSLQVKEP